jgi:hypothetical protein
MGRSVLSTAETDGSLQELEVEVDDIGQGSTLKVEVKVVSSITTILI